MANPVADSYNLHRLADSDRDVVTVQIQAEADGGDRTESQTHIRMRMRASDRTKILAYRSRDVNFRSVIVGVYPFCNIAVWIGSTLTSSRVRLTNRISYPY